MWTDNRTIENRKFNCALGCENHEYATGEQSESIE